MLQRAALEAAKPSADVEEVLLAQPWPSAGVTEGLSSNFFVVSRDGTVMTAGEGDVLAGTVRDAALQACVARRVPVVLEAPRLLDAPNEWAGAFITSTSRMLLPVCEIMYTAADGSPARLAFAHGGAPLVEELRRDVAEAMRRRSEPLQ